VKVLDNYIDGAFAAPKSGRYAPVMQPSTGMQYAKVPDSGAEDATHAITAAHAASGAWGKLGAGERGRYLRAIAAGIAARFEEFAQAESIDTGKPIQLARSVDIPRAIQNFEFFASMGETLASQAHPQAGAGLHYTLRQPLGAVVCISPWNLPLYLLSWKIAPALAAGNTVIAKPSEVTPASAHLLAEVIHALNLPRGVLNVLHGAGAGVGPVLATHAKVRAISFTGSTATGRTIATAAAPHFKKLSLEMGGKNATVIFADADFEHAVATSVRAAFANQGQICLCGSRILIEKAIYKDFVAAFVARAAQLQPSDPADENCHFGALVSSAHLQKIQAAVARASDEGGRILLGGERVELAGALAGGYYFPPTVIDQLPNHCATNQEEVFGPVVTLMPFDDEAHAQILVNQSDYGLACSVFTNNLARAHRFSEAVQTGLVWINSWMQRDLRVPFGGMKQSGMGREGGIDAMYFFSESKSVFIPY
jgi:aminomuconate-semialdehyde/2-hydroxymuconate-6-semialdehyde dehydrogenase